MSHLPYIKATTLRNLLFLCGLLLSSAKAELSQSNSLPPQRVISIDYCADQYLLKLGLPKQILGVSAKSTTQFSYMRKEAETIRKVRPFAEDLITLEPDLVIRSFGGGSGIRNFLEQHGVPVLQIDFLDSLEKIKETIVNVSTALGNKALGDELLDQLKQRLLNIPSEGRKSPAMYISGGGVTTGPGTLMHDIMTRGNLRNMVNTPGWRTIPLEQLVSERPEIVVHSFFENFMTNNGAWSPARHPITKKFLHSNPNQSIAPVLLSCGGWYSVDAIEKLSQVSRDREIN